ncbi:condensation domain-containing protein [Streptomyces sp. KL118A]|uniref:condensation domain-containing protein n=1 Tax=Streptomyces sp. KL118A TaxID=3045153 RepID=UPI00278BD8F8|nr:condensation domain-containing protein [Streptomyces sp. KL118A]
MTGGRREFPSERGGDIPLSYAQQGLWFLERRSGHPRHSDPVTFRLVGELDAAALRASVEEIVGRHEALRTRFPVVAGLPVQRVSPRSEVPLPLTDLTDLPAAEREKAAARLLAEDLRRPFDLVHGPVARGVLIRLGPREHIVRISLHHLVSDAWSWWSVILRELEQLYTAHLHGRPSPLPPPPAQYRDFVRRQNDWLNGPVYPEQLTHWKEKLANATVLPPLDLASPAPTPSEQLPRTRWMAVPQPLGDRLRAAARSERASLFMVLLTAANRLLRRHVDTDDILVGTRGGFRTQADFEKAVGLFVNLLPVRTRVPVDADFRDLLRQVRRNLIEVYTHRNLPFERLAHDLGLWAPGFRPAIGVCVSFQTTPEVPPALEGLETTLINHDPFSPYPLDLGFYEDAGALRVLLVHDPGVYDDTAAARLLDDLHEELEAGCRELEDG